MMRKLLIANRGEIACRVIRAAKELGIATVAVYSDADVDAPHVRLASEGVHLVGTSPGDTYLRGDLIIAAAVRLGADAIHPGYGFLSEHAEFAQACRDAGIVFVGPSPGAIAAMGNKIEAKARMAEAGVPVLGGATISADMDAAALTTTGAGVGYPILVKAAFGGGGRGMRIVREPSELREAVASAQREAAAAFGDGLVFLERYVESPRHIEVQIVGDMHGNVVHLFERECSIQRRHQKIIEEAPSTAVDAALRAELGAAAVAAGRAIDYVGAGTVEFVMAPDGQFYFLEVNTRLQVEHPITECITGIDLVQLQLGIAQGDVLPDAVMHAQIRGHAIEARLYAEDVPAGFVPMSGPLHCFDIGGDDVRVDSGYDTGTSVSTFYDAMLAKVIVWAPTRDLAATRLGRVLRDARIHGVITNRSLLVATLAHPDFVAGMTDTGFYDRHDPAMLGAADSSPTIQRAHAVASALVGALDRSTAIGAGFRNVGGLAQSTAWDFGGTQLIVEYTVQRDRTFAVAVDGAPVDVELVQRTADGIVVAFDGVRRPYRVHVVGATSYVDSALGSTECTMVARFPQPEILVTQGSLRSPLPGSVVAVHATLGAVVSQGEVLVALEAMKMEHSIRAPHDGVVSDIRVAVGTQVETGAILVVVDEHLQE